MSKNPEYRPCDLCQGAEARFVLASRRLSGPLVRCADCGLFYVGLYEREFVFSQPDCEKSHMLSEEVKRLDLINPAVESRELPWKMRRLESRVSALKRYLPNGRILEIGAGGGEFLLAANRAGYEVAGVEPDPHTSKHARDILGLPVITATVGQAAFPPESFDGIVMIHVIEHVSSPCEVVRMARRLLRPGGVIMIETPNIGSWWFRLFRRRWRQLIPDHFFFFGRDTMRGLLAKTGFELLGFEKAEVIVSARLAADRIRRMSGMAGKSVASLIRRLRCEEATIRFAPRDIMLVFAKKVTTTELKDR